MEKKTWKKRMEISAVNALVANSHHVYLRLFARIGDRCYCRCVRVSLTLSVVNSAYTYTT